MRLLPRLIIASVLVALPAGAAVASCATDAVGVDACRTIDEARCELVPPCQPGFDVDQCKRFYRDQCLNGIQNTAASGDLAAQAKACVDALKGVAACADGGAGACPDPTTLVPDASCSGAPTTDPTACNVIQYCPEALAACNFVQASADAGSDAATTTDAGDGGATDAGDAATD